MHRCSGTACCVLLSGNHVAALMVVTAAGQQTKAQHHEEEQQEDFLAGAACSCPMLMGLPPVGIAPAPPDSAGSAGFLLTM